MNNPIPYKLVERLTANLQKSIKNPKTTRIVNSQHCCLCHRKLSIGTKVWSFTLKLTIPQVFPLTLYACADMDACEYLVALKSEEELDNYQGETHEF